MYLPISPTSGSNRPPKVPIPRLEKQPHDKPWTGAVRARNTQRSPRACLRCRERKVRCDGEQPGCSNCRDSEHPCVYQANRTNRLRTAKEQNQDMVTLLKDLRVSVTEDKRQKIDALLQRVTDNISDATTISDLRRSPDFEEIEGETNASTEIGPNEASDVVDTDLLHDTETLATGFVGKSSGLQWMRHIQNQLDRPEEQPLLQPEDPRGPPGDSGVNLQRLKALGKRQELKNWPDWDLSAPLPVSASSFYLDNYDVDVDYAIDPYELPLMETAQMLVDSYMTSVQDSFPIVPRSSFLNNFYAYYESAGQGVRLAVPNKWLAILNLVFAIGAKYLHLIQANWRMHGRDHLIYQSRARILGLHGPSLVSNPDLMQVQITALLALYFLVVGRVNRAWVVVGIALRDAQALGLHLRNEDRTISIARKETLLHIWWGTCCLETILSVVLGRPSFIVEDYCSVPLPVALTTEQLADSTLAYQPQEGHTLIESQKRSSTTDLATSDPLKASYLRGTIQVVLITQRAMAQLYAANVVSRSWKQVQQTISDLCNELEAWVASLPPGLDFVRPNASADFHRERLILNMQYLGSQLLIMRPCLCRLDGRVANQTKASDSFDKKTAIMCVKAAMAMANLIPDRTDSVGLYRIGPWWTLVHSIMQALTVLLLELSYGTIHAPGDNKAILLSSKKIIRWLRWVKGGDQVAERAYTLAFGLLQRLAPRINADISDLVKEDAACSEHDTRSGAEIHSNNGGRSQGHPFSTDVGEHRFGPGIPAVGYNDFYRGHGPMSSHALVPPQEQLRPDLTFPSDLTCSQSIFNPSFTACYDEEGPIYYNNLFSSTDVAMPDIMDENFPL